jgi:hypothetical protein
MLKKILLITLSALLISRYVSAKLPLRMPKKEQVEDMRYYQNFHWSKPPERKVMYEALANGQFHMYEKMRTCEVKTLDLATWLEAFKKGAEEVADTEYDFLMRDMDDNLIVDAENGDLVAIWLTRDFAEAHFEVFTGGNLRKLQDQLWQHCLTTLPVKLFTKEERDKVDAKRQAKELQEMGYP